MLLNKRKLTNVSRLKKLQQAQVKQELMSVQKAAEEHQNKQSAFEKKQAELEQSVQTFNKHFQSDNLSPVVMGNANAVIAQEEVACKQAKQAAREARESLEGVLSGYLNSKKNMDWLEKQKRFFQSELNTEVQKIETEELTQLHSSRGGKQ